MKVFGIGLPRCGGQTLQQVLGTLRGTCIHSPGNSLEHYNSYDTFAEVFRHPADLVRDYGEDCRFIMNTRNVKSWFASCERMYQHSGPWNHPIWKYPLCDFYGYRDAYIDSRSTYFDTYWEVKCLWIDVTVEKDWTRICEFLEVPVPDLPWPKIDKVSDVLETRRKAYIQ